MLEGARAEAVRLEHDAIGAEHIVLALLEPGSPGRAAVERLGLEPSLVRQRLEAGARRGRARSGSEELAYTSHAKRLIEVASKEAREAGTGLAAEHLLLAALSEPRGTMGKLLVEAAITPESARRLAVGEPREAAPADLERGPRSGGAGRGPAVRGGRAARELDGHVRGPASPAPPTAPRRALPWRVALLPAVPVSIVFGYVLHASPTWVFITACLGVLPLAAYMGEATEHLAHRTGPTIGGLMNATFGNAAELIIAIVALRAGLVDLVKASITGSILGNLLLILGLAIVAGGTRFADLRFNRTSAGLSAGMLALAVVSLVFPALFHALHPEVAARTSELRLSAAVAVILIATYGLSLLFSLKTHRRVLGGEPHPTQGPVWSPLKATAVLAAATVAVAVESELLVHAASEASRTLGLSGTFLGLIVIPVIGNAAEHAAAVVVSRKGQIDLGLQIALGSSTQVALLVAPLLVFAGMILGQPMNLVFSTFEVLALGLATGLTAIITLDGESHWFEGVQFLAVYGIVAVAALFLG